MHKKSIKIMKQELKRIRKRQDKKNKNNKMIRKKSKIRSQLWSLLKEKAPTRKTV